MHTMLRHTYFYIHRNKDILHTFILLGQPWMLETEGIETESLLEPCNLFTEGHILCLAQMQPSSSIPLRVCVCVCLRVLAKFERAWEKKWLMEKKTWGVCFQQSDDELAEECAAMQVWAGGQWGGHRSRVCDEGCETVMDPEDTWSELCGMCSHHRSGTQLTLYCPRTQTYWIHGQLPLLYEDVLQWHVKLFPIISCPFFVS